MARLDVEDGLGTRLGREHLEAQPGQIGSAQPLHGMESRGVGGQQSRHTGHRRPHQHLVARDHTQRGRQTATHAALAGGGDERQVAGARDGQKQHNGGDKGAVVCNAEHVGFLWKAGRSAQRCGPEPEFTRPPLPRLKKIRQAGFIQTMQRSASSPGTVSCST